MTRKPTCVACKGAGANYTAGTGIVIESNEISADTSVLATKTELEDYQPVLTAGDGINISENNVISTDVGGFTKYTETDWTIFKSNGVVTEDLLIRFNDGKITGFMFIPKSTPVTFGANVTFGRDQRPTMTNNRFSYAGNTIDSILNSGINVPLNISMIEFTRNSDATIGTLYLTVDETYQLSKSTGYVEVYRRV